MSGVLVLVGTPIGHLGDLTPRAVEVLAAADAIVCEDTRRTSALLTHAGIDRPPLLVAHDHAEASQVGPVVERLGEGERVAVVSDAGMPGVSDPGERLVVAAVAAGHAVEVVPGPTAAVAALVVSGLPTGRWCFEGFLPRKGAGRTERLLHLAEEPRTTVLYEAPHRLARTLADLVSACGGERPVVVTRELTKLHEEHWRGDLAGAAAWAAAAKVRGEVAVVLGGAPPRAEVDDDTLRKALRAELAAGAHTKEAAGSVAEHYGVSRRRVYALAIDGDDAG